MLKTWTLRRPTVVFNPADAAHRRAYRDFLKNNSWSECPFNFILEEPFSDLISNINYKITLWYLDNEFAKKQLKAVDKIKIS
jgi:hypothetical protein